MFINPRTAIEKGWITGPMTEDTIQPNAIDFTADRMFSIEGGVFVLNVDGKQMRKQSELKPTIRQDGKEYFRLQGKHSYDAMSDLFVDLPEGVACLLIVRSTLNRNGLFITSGLYDQGFKGNIGFVIHNNNDSLAFIEPHSRVGQIMFFRSEHTGQLYKGGWNTDQGEHWSEADGD